MAVRPRPRSTLLDRVIGYFAPRTGLQRVQARAALSLATRGYEAARGGRRTEGWTATNASANAEIGAAGTTLRKLARDLVRNNPHARKAVAVMVNNIVGAGIVPRAATGDERRDRAINDAFAAWSEDCDALGQIDFYGLQSLACRAMIESGEVLIRRRPRRSGDGLAVPMQLQLLEADFLDAAHSGPLANGRLIQGVEFDALDRRRAYWLFDGHPGDAYGGPAGRRWTSVAVPAGEIAHLYALIDGRPGQVRGVPWLAPVMLKLRDLDDYQEAEQVRKKIEACLAAIVFGDDEADPGVNTLKVTDAEGRTIEQFEPGLIAYARGGKDIRTTAPAATDSYADYVRAQLHSIASGALVTYELLSGDLSQVNYSSIRAGLVEFRRLAEVLQWQCLIPMFCRPLWRWFIDAAFLAGRIPAADYRVKWAPPRFEAVDPVKDAAADLIEIRAGLTTLPQAIARRGYDPAEQLAEIAAANALLDRLGLTLDSDPRRMTKAGAPILDPADEQRDADDDLISRLAGAAGRPNRSDSGHA